MRSFITALAFVVVGLASVPAYADPPVTHPAAKARVHRVHRVHRAHHHRHVHAQH